MSKIIEHHSKDAVAKDLQYTKKMFFVEQRALTLVLKDPLDFFREYANLMTRRLENPNKITKIIVVHPDSLHVAATPHGDRDIALARPNEALHAIRFMQALRGGISSYGKGNSANHSPFRGHYYTPEWSGMVGDEVAFVQMHTLPVGRKTPRTLILHKDQKQLTDGVSYALLSKDSEMIFNTTHYEDNDLWRYKLPQKLPQLG